MFLESITPIEMQIYVIIGAFLISLVIDLIFYKKTIINRVVTLSNFWIVYWLAITMAIGFSQLGGATITRGWDYSLITIMRLFASLALPVVYIYIQVSFYRSLSKIKLQEEYKDTPTFFYNTRSPAHNTIIFGLYCLFFYVSIKFYTSTNPGYIIIPIIPISTNPYYIIIPIIPIFLSIPIGLLLYVYYDQMKKKELIEITSDFIPDKAYLIKGKSMEQVKKEAKRWLTENKIKIVSEGENELETDELIPEYPDDKINLRLSQMGWDTLVIFCDEKSNKDLKEKIIEQKKLDLVRFLQGREELKLSYSRITVLGTDLFQRILTFLILLALFQAMNSFYPRINISIIIIPAIFVLIITRLYLSRKYGESGIQKMANLPKYKVEGYQEVVILERNNEEKK
jgi:hypothetical protein